MKILSRYILQEYLGNLLLGLVIFTFVLLLDHLFELADLLSLTVVRSHPSRLGQEAAALTFARLDGDRRAAQRVVVPTELVPRGSGELTP